VDGGYLTAAPGQPTPAVSQAPLTGLERCQVTAAPGADSKNPTARRAAVGS